MVSGEPRWMTAAIDRNFSGTRLIREMHFLSDIPWRQKMSRTLEFNYGKHPFFNQTMDVIIPLILNDESNVSEYNIGVIQAVAQKLGLEASKFVRSSEFAVESASNELLCDLTLSVAGETYLCGGGASGYQDEAVFKSKGVDLRYQNFAHPTYRQLGGEEFNPGLAIIDVAMNIGWDGAGSLLSGT